MNKSDSSLLEISEYRQSIYRHPNSPVGETKLNKTTNTYKSTYS